MISDDELDEMEDRCNATSPTPWQSFIEGRDHFSGSNFIRTGDLDDSCPDIYLTGATHADQDFIAHARQDIPALISELRHLRALVSQSPGSGA